MFERYVERGTAYLNGKLPVSLPSQWNPESSENCSRRSKYHKNVTGLLADNYLARRYGEHELLYLGSV